VFVAERRPGHRFGRYVERAHVRVALDDGEAGAVDGDRGADLARLEEI
jgi:hypothetical protein